MNTCTSNAPRFAAWILLTSLALCGTAAGSGSAPAERHSTLSLAPCELEDAAHYSVRSAECGTLLVPEDPANPSGRQIALYVARVPAISRRKAPDPLFILAGGPGMAATTMYAGTASAFDRIHRSRDIVLVDQRGTGRSNPLDCPFDDEDLLRATAATLESETRRCLADLSTRANVAFYTTSVAVRDLDRVREALGYEQIDLYGASYGTRVAEHYLRRFPHRARAVILDGVLAPQEILGPDIALDAENALLDILRRCSRDTACSLRFGDPVRTYRALRETLARGAVPVDFMDPTSGEPAHLDFGLPQFATVLRLSTYTSMQAAVLPLVLDSARRGGNFRPLAGQFMLLMKSYEDVLAYGMHNSVICTEDVPFYTPQQLDRKKMLHTFLGTTQIDALQSLCRGWPRGPMDADLHAPLRSDVPVLMLSGGNDPITPADRAEHARTGLTHSLHLVIPHLGHGQLTTPCVDGIMEEFIERASVDGLDVSCTQRVKPAPFFLSPAGPAP